MADFWQNIKMGIDNSPLVKGLGASRSQLKKFHRYVEADWKRHGQTIKKSMLVGVAATTAMTARVITQGAEIEKLSKIANTNSDEFQSLAFAYSNFGITAEQTSEILKELSVKINDLRNDSSAMKEAFGDLGLTLDDFGQNSVENLRIVNEALRGIEDPLRRAAIASDILTTGGEELAAVHAQTAESILELQQRFDYLGASMDTVAVQNGQKLKTEFQLITQIIQNNFANGVLSGIKVTKEWDDSLKKLGETTRNVGELIPKMTSFVAENNNAILAIIGSYGLYRGATSRTAKNIIQLTRAVGLKSMAGTLAGNLFGLKAVIATLIGAGGLYTLSRALKDATSSAEDFHIGAVGGTEQSAAELVKRMAALEKEIVDATLAMANMAKTEHGLNEMGDDANYASNRVEELSKNWEAARDLIREANKDLKPVFHEHRVQIDRIKQAVEEMATAYGNAFEKMRTLEQHTASAQQAIFQGKRMVEEDRKKAKESRTQLGGFSDADRMHEMARHRQVERSRAHLRSMTDMGVDPRRQSLDIMRIQHIQSKLLADNVKFVNKYSVDMNKNIHSALMSGIKSGNWDSLEDLFMNELMNSLMSGLFGIDMGGGGGLGGLLGGFLGLFHDGTDYVPRDGFALLEKGEAVVSKEDNASGMRGGITNNINVLGDLRQPTLDTIRDNQSDISSVRLEYQRENRLV